MEIRFRPWWDITVYHRRSSHSSSCSMNDLSALILWLGVSDFFEVQTVRQECMLHHCFSSSSLEIRIANERSCGGIQWHTELNFLRKLQRILFIRNLLSFNHIRLKSLLTYRTLKFVFKQLIILKLSLFSYLFQIRILK